ncbi:MAG: 3-oxoacyl-ACP synthase, partial [Fimbriimonadaceae bacterium]|nr:3-oxoacyl-ACP synthase [Fimbriimonadaceae bacterium]
MSQTQTRAIIRGIGAGIPDRVLTNAELSTMVDTDDEWILQRTGIRERRIVADGQQCSDLAAAAAQEALDMAGFDPMTLDLIVVGTVTGDFVFPSTACLVQEKIGAKRAGALDVGAACAGFIYSLDFASAMIEGGRAQRVLVLGADVLSRHVDWTDRSTCILL